MTMDKKQRWVSQAPTEVLQRITNSLSGAEAVEREQQSNRFPLAGLVHIDGVGQVAVKALREELARRETSTA